MLKCKKVYVIQCSVVVCGQDINVHVFPLFSFSSGKTKISGNINFFFSWGTFFPRVFLFLVENGFTQDNTLIFRQWKIQ